MSKETIKVIKTLREMYFNSRVGKTFKEEKQTWAHITAECAKRKISPDIIQISEEVFEKMSEAMILRDYTLKD